MELNPRKSRQASQNSPEFLVEFHKDIWEDFGTQITVGRMFRGNDVPWPGCTVGVPARDRETAFKPTPKRERGRPARFRKNNRTDAEARAFRSHDERLHVLRNGFDDVDYNRIAELGIGLSI